MRETLLDAGCEDVTGSEHQVVHYLQDLGRITGFQSSLVKIVSEVRFFEDALELVEIVLQLADVVVAGGDV